MNRQIPTNFYPDAHRNALRLRTEFLAEGARWIGTTRLAHGLFATIAIMAAGLVSVHLMSSTATAAMRLAPSHGEATASIIGGDSRTDSYRLERDSCCVGES